MVKVNEEMHNVYLSAITSDGQVPTMNYGLRHVV